MGAICEFCNLDMTTADGCRPHTIHTRSKEMQPIPYGSDEEGWKVMDIQPPERCHDCGCKLGQFHHPGCDVEQCPHPKHAAIPGSRPQAFICDHCKDRRPTLL